MMENAQKTPSIFESEAAKVDNLYDITNIEDLFSDQNVNAQKFAKHHHPTDKNPTINGT